jgi:hypothetical protein
MSAFSAFDLVAASLLRNILSKTCEIDFHETNTVYVGNYSGVARYQEVLTGTSRAVIDHSSVPLKL